MSLTDTNLEFSSTWDIDQLVASGETVVPLGATVLYTFANAAAPPVFEVMFKATGTTRWFQSGQNSPDDTNANSYSIYSYIENNTVVVYIPSRGGTARYYIWSDRIIQ